MAYAGYGSTLKASGTAVPVTGEACSVVTTGSVYQVTATARRIIDPAAAVVVKDNGTTIASTLWSLNYLFGIITFSGYTATGPVTVDMSYLPTSAVAEVRSSSVDAKANVLGASSYDSAGWAQKVLGTRSASGSFEFLSLMTADIDPVASGVQSLYGLHGAGTPKLLELTWGAGALIWRGWVLLSGLSQKSDADGLLVTTASYESAPQKVGAAYGFGT